MIQPGIIRITDKVYFKSDGLWKPRKDGSIFLKDGYFNANLFKKKLKEYKDSKQLIEVSNEHAVGNIYPDSVYIYIENKLRKAKNNDPCKAEVIGKICTIVELTKEGK